MSIVTGKGDDGLSSLFGGKRVPKNHPRLEAYGAVDEAQSAVGMVRAGSSVSGGIDEVLAKVQVDLFTVGSDLATPDPIPNVPRVTHSMIKWVEDECKNLEESLPELKNFIVPTGSQAASTCFWARSVVRRAERGVAAMVEGSREVQNALIYLNRLSDLLFLVARKLNAEVGIGDEEWRGR